MFRLHADKVSLSVLERETVTTGSVNVYRVRFSFSADWDGLDKTAVFRVGAESRSVRLGQDGTCEIPWEILPHDAANRALYIGVYGLRGEAEVLPTIWVNAGTVRLGASPGEEAAPPTPGLYEQIVEQFRSMSEQTLTGAGEILAGAESAASEAEESASSASQSASNAERSAQAASATLGEVQKAASTAAAEAAEQTAEALQGYLSNAQTAEQNAHQAEQDAVAAKESAEGAAQESNRAARSAGASATEAGRFKDEALTAKEAAEAAAGSASDQAKAALSSASGAEQSSESASQSAQHAEDFKKSAEDAAKEAGDILAEVKQLSPVGPVALPTQSGTLTYNGEPQYPLWAGYDPKKLLLGGVTFARDAGTYTATFTPRGNCTWPEGGTESRTAEWSIAKAAGEVTAEDAPAITLRHPVGKIQVIRSGDGAVSAESGSPEVAEVAVNGTEITVTGLSSGHAEITIQVAETENYFAVGGTVGIDVMFSHVFGVMWDYSNSSTALLRLTVANDPNGYVTNDITEEPVPAIGSGAGSSPFDAYFPWSGMEEYNILPDGGIIKSGSAGFSRTEHDTMVYIPEFYYRVVDDSENSKRCWYIADGPFPDFEKHPGSRKYVSKYPAGENYAVKSGLAPLVDIMRSEARTGATAKGDGWRLYDFATYCAILIIYLVEFSDWNSQEKIGYGCVWMNENTDSGHTDIMNYHTGTADSARDKGHDSVQFRHLENLWGNVNQFVDGYIAIGTNGYTSTEPEQYNDTSSEGYTHLGKRDIGGNQYIKALAFSKEAPWAFFPTEFIDRTGIAWIPDRANNSNLTQILVVGGARSSARDAGLFAYTAEWDSRSAAYWNCARLIYDRVGNGGKNEDQSED